jgi:magnesium transporter
MTQGERGPETTASAPEAPPDRVTALLAQVTARDARAAAQLLALEPDEVVVAVFEALNPAVVQAILAKLTVIRSQAIVAAAPVELARQWSRNQHYPAKTVGRLMDPPVAVFAPGITVEQVIEHLRELVKRRFITYGFVVDEAERLLGVLVMRDLLFAPHGARLADVMVRNPFFLTPTMSLMEAMRQTLTRHYPVYPVCDEDGRLVGTVRGQVLGEAQAFQISAQAGSMVGVEQEERLSTPWPRSLRFRHPWLQLNLLTAFVAGGVVSFFQPTIDRLVILAVFLPVLAGQCGNTGCQALAVALRGMTLGDLEPGSERRLVFKEAILGLANGAMVGVTAAVGMYALATWQGNPRAPALAGVVLLSMMGSCLISGIAGALVPLGLKRVGADPATASSIFLTTATDVASMGMFLGLAKTFVT